MLAPGAETDQLVTALGLAPSATMNWAVRPENVGLAGSGMQGEGLAGTVKKFTYLGREAHLQVATAVGDLVAQISNPSRTTALQSGAATTVIIAKDGLMGFDGNGRRLAGH